MNDFKINLLDTYIMILSNVNRLNVSVSVITYVSRPQSDSSASSSLPDCTELQLLSVSKSLSLSISTCWIGKFKHP